MPQLNTDEDIKRREAAETMRKSGLKFIIGVVLMIIAWYIYHSA